MIIYTDNLLVLLFNFDAYFFEDNNIDKFIQ